MFQNPYGGTRLSIADVIPGLGKWVMQNRQKAMQPIMDAGRERAMSLLGTEGTGFDEINENTRFEDVQEAQGLLADPEDFGNQMRFSLGLLGTPGYSDLGSNIASQALKQQLGLPMELLKMAQGMNKPTTAMQNLQAAGYTPGTPEYQQAMQDYMMKAQNQTTIQMPNQAEMVAGARAQQAITAGAMVNDAYDQGYTYSAADYAASMLPDFIGGPMMSDAGRQMQATEQAWAEANLRSESGGAITDEEWKAKRDTYFPLPWDDEATKERKRKLRSVQEQGLIRQAGRSTVEPPKPGENVTATPDQAPAGVVMRLPPGVQPVPDTGRKVGGNNKRRTGLNR